MGSRGWDGSHELTEFQKKSSWPKSSILAPLISLWVVGAGMAHMTSHTSSSQEHFRQLMYNTGLILPRRAWAKTPKANPPESCLIGKEKPIDTVPSIPTLKRARDIEKGSSKSVSSWMRNQRKEPRILIKQRGNLFLSITKKKFRQYMYFYLVFKIF
jgi:hypothetical protein